MPKSFIANLNDFVDLYINNIVPRSVNFAFFYTINREVVVGTQQ